MSDHNPILAEQPALYVVATPMGNMRDMTLRALDVLAAVDVIAAEDTRHSLGLLQMYTIRTPMFALHEHNEQAAADKLVAQLVQGKHVALITDAGTPAVSDPGAKAVARVREAGFPVVPVPGPCAAVAALSVSGFAARQGFWFVGFLPVKSAARQGMLRELAASPAALVFYEAPHRLSAMAQDMLAVLGGDREVMVGRELTKMHEETARMLMSALPDWLVGNSFRQKGEFVLVVAPAAVPQVDVSGADEVLRACLSYLPLNQAARLAASLTGQSKNTLYARGLVLQEQTGGR